MTGVDHIHGQTVHIRRGAVSHAFRYGVDYVMLDPETVPEGPRLFRRNRFGLMTLRDRDHGGAPGLGRGAAWLHEVLAARQIAIPGLRITLLAQPRVLGHVFNPVSFWLCHDGDGALRVVVAEVSNTFGDRHSYLCAHPDLQPIGRSDVLTAVKVFHVSPFQPIGGAYRFRFDITPERIGIWIDFDAGQAGGGVYATLTGRRRPLTNRAVLRACTRMGSRRVLALIHWQALRLWWKGARYRVRPAPPADEVSR